jgi:hypothetical protein
MPVTAMTPIWICHAFEGFYFGIDMFNDNPPLRQFFVIRSFLIGQWMMFARFDWNGAVRMEALYPQISQIRVKRYRIADRTPDAVLIHLEVMLAAFGLLNIQYFPGVSLNYCLCLQRVPFFFPNSTLFALLSGGLWDFP